MSPARDARDDADMLGRVGGFRHSMTLPVLGIPVVFETNDTRVVALVERAFGRWAHVEMPDAGRVEQARVRFTVERGEEHGEHASLRYRTGDDGYVLVTTAASAGYADPLRREVRAWVTDALVDDAQHFRYGVLEALTNALLTRLDRQPVHAAALARDGAALLLAGPSGAGKSTLSYAAACAGIGVLAEDVVYVQLVPGLRVWGASSYLHLPPESVRLFPELGRAESVQLANGKRKLVVDAGGGAAPDSPFADIAGVCILRRGTESRPSLRELSPAEVVETLGSDLEQGFDLFADTIAAAHAALGRGGGWALTIGGPPAGHLPLLHRMLDALRARG